MFCSRSPSQTLPRGPDNGRESGIGVGVATKVLLLDMGFRTDGYSFPARYTHSHRLLAQIVHLSESLATDGRTEIISLKPTPFILTTISRH